MTLSATIGQYSCAGRKPENQDFHGASVPEGAALALKGITVAIADGISTSPVAREAAETAVGTLMADYYAAPEAWTVETAASKVIAATNSWMCARNQSLSDVNRGHVCTLSALILKGRAAHILHVGDARVARVSGLSLEPLTEDHKAHLNGEDYLGRALGVTEALKIDYTRVPVTVGDVFLMTTDGVHDTLNPRVLAEMAKAAEPEITARQIVEAALAAGSDDNLTALVVRVDGLPGAGAEIEMDLTGLKVPDLPKPGDVLDGFRIVRPIHGTARSHVFLAVGPGEDRVALKIPAGDTSQDPAYIRRFVLEEWVARRVASPHVLKPAEAPARRTALYVVNEWVEGVTLRQWMIDHPTPDLDTVRGIVGQIAQGLRALHRRQMIHQDMRPENVMIDADGTVKIIDLGSVTVAGIEEAAPGLLGAMPGTFQYTAPEYFSGDVVSWRSDQFALAVITYEMLTGRLPYGTQVAKIRTRADQRSLAYTPARDDHSPVPDWMDACLQKALHPDPVRRYDALSEFLADLRRPSKIWQSRRHVPLMERDPVRFWQALAGLLAIALAVSLITRP